MSKQAKK